MPIVSSPSLILAAFLTVATATGQEPEYAEWRLVEAAPETLQYRNALRNGVFDDSSRIYLRDIALPQLAAPGNMAMIDRVRRRLRDVTCDPSGAGSAVDQAAQFVVDSMNRLVADETFDAVVRVNAMLLIGDVNAKGGKPFPGAMVPLTAAVADARLPAAVRIAAAAGLARHVDAADGPLPAATTDALVALISTSADTDPTAAEWLAARGLGMLAQLGPAAPGPAVSAACGMLSDPELSTDLRVRAAAVVGASVAPDAGIEPAKAVAAIREIAVATLETEATVDAATAPVQGLACRQAAWRLDTLGKALGGEDGRGGLARTAGPVQADATELAAVLRQAAMQIDARPDVFTIREALRTLAPQSAGAGTAPAAQRPSEPSPPAADQGDAPFNPFGQ